MSQDIRRWNHGEHGPRPSVSLLQDRLCSLSHLAVTCRSEPPPWVSSWPDLAVDWLPVTELETHVGLHLLCIPWAASLGPALWKKLGQLQFSHFFVHKQKGALLCGEEGAGGMRVMLLIFCSTAVTEFIGGLLKL